MHDNMDVPVIIPGRCVGIVVIILYYTVNNLNGDLVYVILGTDLFISRLMCLIRLI